jgi:hypothetical protein
VILILMLIVIALTVLEFRCVERRMQYSNRRGFARQKHGFSQKAFDKSRWFLLGAFRVTARASPASLPTERKVGSGPDRFDRSRCRYGQGTALNPA